jgi:hypothetical protein
MQENRSLGEGVELICELTFSPEGIWTIRKGDMVWSKIEGWKKHHGVIRPDTHFETAENAFAGVGTAKQTRIAEYVGT